jgi:hypothetical protein
LHLQSASIPVCDLAFASQSATPGAGVLVFAVKSSCAVVVLDVAGDGVVVALLGVVGIGVVMALLEVVVDGMEQLLLDVVRVDVVVVEVMRASVVVEVNVHAWPSGPA